MARREGNLHFFPDRVEAIGGDSINHRNKRLTPGQTGVRLVDEIEGFVVLKEGPFSGRREFHELDSEQVVVVIGGYYAGRTVWAASLRTGRERQRQTCPDNEFDYVFFHNFAFGFNCVGILTRLTVLPGKWQSRMSVMSENELCSRKLE